MNGNAHQWLLALLLASLGLSAAALMTWCLLRYSRAVSPRVHRLAWCAVLLVGWSFARLPIEVPWYEPLPSAEVAVLLEGSPPVLIMPPNEEMIEAPSVTSLIDLSGNYPEFSPEPVASAAGAEPPIGPAETEQISAPMLVKTPTLALDPLPAETLPAEPLVRPLWAEVDPWLALAAVWAAGIGAILLAWLTGYLWFVLRLPAGRAANSSWLDEWQALLQSRGVRSSIPLRVTDRLGPMLCRLPRGYTLVVPEPLWRDLDESARRAILRHELAHYERGDVWWSLLARVLALPHWFNPASWYCVRKFDEAAEWACDRAATADQPVTDYARALLRLGTDAHGYASYRPAAAGKPLAGRIRRLLRLREARDSKMKAALLIAAALVMATAALVRVELVAREAPTEGEKGASASLQPAIAEALTQPPEKSAEPVKRLSLSSPDTPPGDQAKLIAAAIAAVEAAKKAYEGSIRAYEHGTGVPENAYIWSLRWLDAAGRVPPALKEGQPTIGVDQVRLDAAQAHLERMKELQARVKALFETGAPGGEAEVMAAADFYVAEAERMVAEREDKLPKLDGQPSRVPGARAMDNRKRNLRYDGKSLEEWMQILTTELSDDSQFKAIDALGAFAAKGYGDEVATALLDIRPEPRSGLSAKIVNGLLKIPKDIAIPHLAKAGKSDDEVTRRLALIALANAAPTSAESKAALKSALHDASPIVVEAAINLVGGGSHEKYYLAETPFPAMPELAPDLAELLAKLNENRTEASGNLDRDYLVNALARCGPAAKVALPTVLPWLASEDWNTRVRALRIIGAVGPEAGEAVPALIALLKESTGIDAQNRASSFGGGGMGGGMQSLTALTLHYVATIGPPAKEAVPTILEIAKSTRNLDDVIAAIKALEAIGPLSKDAVPLLIRACEGQHRISMMKKLGQIGPDAAEAIPLLKNYSENAKNIDPAFVDAAREALKKIQPEAN